nr:recombinase family protein [Paludisphaera soli]
MSRIDAASPFAHKIRPRHCDRLAVVYVRQSTPQQVAGDRESADLQYQLRRRAVALGWADDRVLVIDDDQGISGASVENRPGFQRLLAEVSLGHVGVVFGREMSRLSRSCKDWYQLLELCGLFQVLLADADGVYDPTDPNDRMLLGLRSGATYPTVISHRRSTSRYPRAPPPRRRRPVRHRDGLLLEGGLTMARPATARRTAVGRTGLLDRPARRFLPADPGSPAPAGPRPAADVPALPATPERTIDPPPTVGVTPDAFWALLPAADRERFGLRLTRLVLRAVRTHDTEEDG